MRPANVKMMRGRSARFVEGPRVFIWLMAATGALLQIPLVAMQFSSDVTWTPFDFAVAGALLFAAGSLVVLAARTLRTARARLIVCGLVLIALAYIWAELAVGVFTGLGS